VRQASHPIENKESISNMSIMWVTLFLVGLSLVVSVATLLIALRALEKVNRSERVGDEWLEILREQQQRLKLRDERLQGGGGRAVDVLLEEWERQRSKSEDGLRKKPPQEEGEREAAEQALERALDSIHRVA